MYFYRDKEKIEIDLLIEDNGTVVCSCTAPVMLAEGVRAIPLEFV